MKPQIVFFAVIMLAFNAHTKTGQADTVGRTCACVDFMPNIQHYMTQDEIKNLLAKTYKSCSQLPSKVNHAYSPYMRPVFNQVGGSCGSASLVGYMFAYEINVYRRVDGHAPENIYPTHFTHLMAYEHSDKEDLARFNGIPNGITYGGDTYSKIYGNYELGSTEYGWMNGYDRWHSAMFNRLETASGLSLDSPDKLQVFKGWMYNHNGDNDLVEGGVAITGCAITGTTEVAIPAGQYEAGKKLISAWGPQVDHSVTYAGYDDEVGYDFNKDGRITNNVDITGDGAVDMADWEKGALIMLNSWGSSWANAGTIYVPYRLLKIEPRGIEIFYIRKNYVPQWTLKVSMDYSQRVNLKLSVGISSDTNAVSPEKTATCHHFNNDGKGEVPMLGKWADGVMHTEAMEFGLDCTDLTSGYDTNKPFKLFLVAETKTGTSGNGTGKIYSISGIEYRYRDTSYPYTQYDSLIEIGQQSNVQITGGSTVRVSVIMRGMKPNLSVVNGTGSGRYDAGMTVTITANSPAGGKEFDHWEGDVQYITDAQASTTTLTMPEKDITVTAVYKDLPDDGISLPAGLTNTVTVSDTLFYDNGGKYANYSNSFTGQITFYPKNAEQKIALEFLMFAIEDTSSGTMWDSLRIYDGSSTAAPLICSGGYGANNPGKFISTADDGSLTVYFRSDEGVDGTGWQAHVTNEAVAATQQAGERIPASFGLRIHGRTLQYQIPRISPNDVPVSIELYDLRGLHVSTLMHGRVAPGNYTIQFGGRDSNLRLASGTYVCRLHAAGFGKALKMHIIGKN